MTEAGSFVRLEELFSQHSDRLYNFLYWLTNSQAAGEDLASRTFLRFAARHRRLTDTRRAVPLLFGEAVRLATEWEQRQEWTKRLRSLPFFKREPASPDDEPGRDQGPQPATARALREIHPHHRALLLLREGEQMPFAELASVFGFSSSSLRSRLFHAREAIRIKLGYEPGRNRECLQAWKLLSAMRDSGLVHHEQEELKHHLANCPVCAERSQDYESLAHRLQALPKYPAPSALHQRVFGTPTSLSLPLFVPSAGLVMLVVGGLILVALATAIGTAAWQSGFLATIFDKPFAGPAAYVANAGERGSIAIIATKGERVTKVAPVGAQPRSLAVSPDGRFLYIAHDMGVGIMETQTGSITGTIQIPGGAQRVIADPRGRLIYALETARGRFPTRLFVQEANPQSRPDTSVVGTDAYDIVLTNNGRWILALNGRDATITAADTQNLARTQTMHLPRPGYDFTAVPSPDGKHIYVADRRRNLVTIIDAASMAISRTVALGTAREPGTNLNPLARPGLLAGGQSTISTDSKRLYITLLPVEEGLGVYNTDGLVEIGRLKRKATGVALGPDALYVSIASEGVVLVADPVSLQVKTTLAVGENPHSIILKP